jgi:hypothetical protein
MDNDLTFGTYNPSPIKKQNKKKTRTYVIPPLHESRRDDLFKRLTELRGREGDSSAKASKCDSDGTER